MKVIKNPMRPWTKAVIAKIEKEHLKEPFKVILSSYSPKEPHEVALALKSSFPELFWVADMRDEMRFNPHIQEAEKQVLKHLEIKMSKYVDLFTSVSQPIQDAFTENYPLVDSVEIRNGFNFNLKDIEKREFDPNKVHFGYFGTFYKKENQPIS